MPIREELEAVLAGVATARNEPFGGHPLAHRITHDWRDAVAGVVGDPSYKVEGSGGSGNWAETVWLAIFDRTITETAQRGFYVVYLVHKDGSAVYLSLNQGTTEIYDRVGGGRYREVLEDTATRDVGLLEGEDTSGLLAGPIDLNGTGMLTRGYEAGNILALRYLPQSLPDEDERDTNLTRLLMLYQALIEARDQVEADESDSDDPTRPPLRGLEAKRYRWHRRAERSPSLAREAKGIHGTRCQVPTCGKELADTYGEIAEGYIEAHHLTPFASLDGRPTELDPATDFVVVCPDCHRMLHRRAEPYTLDELSLMIEAGG
jgi:5-methylcytosine-specific restriction enzyme A